MHKKMCISALYSIGGARVFVKQMLTMNRSGTEHNHGDAHDDPADRFCRIPTFDWHKT